jgi:hypothetical protein
MTANNPTCQVCGQGTLLKKKKFRMSGPVVFIGYLFLIPSILGILFGILMLVGTGAATGDIVQENKQQYIQELRSGGVPQNLIDKAVAGEVITEADKAPLSKEQRQKLSAAQLNYTAGQAGTGAGVALAGGMSLAMIFGSLVGGLIGWLLIMKKKVLQCTHCSAVVSAS